MRIRRPSSNHNNLVACCWFAFAGMLMTVSAFAPQHTTHHLPKNLASRHTGTTFSQESGHLIPSSKKNGLVHQRRIMQGGNKMRTKSHSTTSLKMVAEFTTLVASFYKGYPLLAGFATASFKAGIADRLAQWKDVCQTKFNGRRNIAMILYSGLILGVSAEIMYNRIFPIIFGTQASTARVFKMVLFDAFFNAPLIWLPPAYLAQALIYRYPFRKAWNKYMVDVRENHLLTKYWSLWLPVQFLNFSIVPAHYRVAFVAFVSFFWMIVLSITANKKSTSKAEPAASCPTTPESRLTFPRAID